MQIFTSLQSVAFGSRRVIPSLDGLRAISITLVLLAHLTGTRGFITFLPLERMGDFGVRVFFVISGYLITSILLKEMERTGTIHLAKFYFARSLRLFPACYAVIGVISALAALGYLQLDKSDILYAVTYSMNYATKPHWHLGHLWSLAVEEQFYLIWPMTLRVLGKDRAIKSLYGIVLIAPIVRKFSLFLGPWAHFLTVSDALAIGCILAAWTRGRNDSPLYRKILESKYFFLVPLAALFTNYIPSYTFSCLIGQTAMNVAIALTVDWSIQNKESAVGRVLNLPSVSFVGVLSYSIYLWQQPFLDRHSFAFVTSFPLNLLLALPIALISYLCIETPFMRLRSRLEPKLFAGRRKYAPVMAGATEL